MFTHSRKTRKREVGDQIWHESRTNTRSDVIARNMPSSAPKVALLSVPTKTQSMSFIALILKPVAYLGLPAYLLHRISQTSPLARYYIRNVFYVLSLSFCSTLGFCSALPLSLLGRRHDVNYVVARTFYAIFSRLSGVQIVVEGEEHLQKRPCVFVGNHQSMVDVLVLGRCVMGPVSFPHDLIVPIACFLWGPGYWPKNRSNTCRSWVNSCRPQAPCS